MKIGTYRSPKFKRLQRALDLPTHILVGHLEMLWHFVAEQADRGDVGRYSDEEIEAEIGWEGPQGMMIQALVKAGWLDQCETHRLVVHDWESHAPDYLKKRVQRAVGRGEPGFAAVSGQRQTTAVTDRTTVTTDCPPSQAKPNQAKPSVYTPAADGSHTQEGSEKRPEPRAKRKTPKVPYPGDLTPERFADIASKYGVERLQLVSAVEEWVAESDPRYTLAGWPLVVDRALRDRWSRFQHLFKSGAYQAPHKPSHAEARQERTRAAARGALEDFRNNGLGGEGKVT